VPAQRLFFEREIDLPRAIVWDALVDPELVSGWLAGAEIEPVIGGRYDLSWLHSSDPLTAGIIDELHEPHALVIDTDNRGRIDFRLDDAPGGFRGSVTILRLTVTLELDAAFSARVRANWMIGLDQLEELLRGHPVDWANWDRDRMGTWTEYRNLFASGHR
jgi:uncharacterized protein YndB with AHSA1/START domain